MRWFKNTKEIQWKPPPFLVVAFIPRNDNKQITHPAFTIAVFYIRKRLLINEKKKRALKKFIRRFLLKKKFRLKFVQFVFVCVLCSDFTKRKFSWYFRKSIWHVSIFVCWFVLFFFFRSAKNWIHKIDKTKSVLKCE